MEMSESRYARARETSYDLQESIPLYPLLECVYIHPSLSTYFSTALSSILNKRTKGENSDK